MKWFKWHLPDILFIWFIATLILPNVLLSVTEPMSLWACVANVALPLAAIMLAGLLSRHVGRTVWLMLPLAVLAAFQIVLLGLYGRSVIAVDMFLNVVTTNSSEVGELLGSLLPSMILVVVLYLPPLALAIVMWRRRGQLSSIFVSRCRLASLAIGAVGVVTLAGSYLSPRAYAATSDLYPLNAGYNICLAVDRTMRTGHYDDTSAAYTYSPSCTVPDSVSRTVILVVGETSRAADWQLLGYDRPTNPRLSGRKAELFVAPLALSESNTTHKSVPMLLSPVEATTFDADIYRVKSLITAFKEAGYATAFFSNQLPNHSFIDFFGGEADTCVFIRTLPDHADRPGDFELVDMTRSFLDASKAKKNLVVLHTYGSHFNYRDRYGKEDTRFTPDDFSEATASNRAKLVNGYDNTIVATDRFLDSLISLADSRGNEAALLYASDHGEDIFDGGSGRFLHASPVPTRMQVHVPMLVWLSEDYREAEPEVADALGRNMQKQVSTSRSYCPTALTLGGITSGRIDPEASLATRAYKPRQPLYLNDHNEPVALNSILQ